MHGDASGSVDSDHPLYRTLVCPPVNLPIQTLFRVIFGDLEFPFKNTPSRLDPGSFRELDVCSMRRTIMKLVLLLSAVLAICAAPVEEPSIVRGADELFWVPTLEQGLEMAAATGRPLFLMGYSLVDERSTYSKLGPDYCSSVF